MKSAIFWIWIGLNHGSHATPNVLATFYTEESCLAASAQLKDKTKGSFASGVPSVCIKIEKGDVR